MEKNLILQILAGKAMGGKTQPQWDPTRNPEDLKILTRRLIEEKPETFDQYLTAVESWRWMAETHAEEIGAEIKECPPEKRCEILARILSQN